MATADQYWELADQYLTEANDPSATPDQAAYARKLYAEAVQNAEAAEDEGDEA